MNPIDIVMLILAIAIFGLAVAHLIRNKVSGKSSACDCGNNHLSGKSLVEEYRKAYPKEQGCCGASKQSQSKE